MRTVIVLLRSEHFGAGKSWAALSFMNPTKDHIKRLVMDGERRDEGYQSVDDEDLPERAMFAFDMWHTIYGEDFVAGLVKMILDLQESKFGYNTFVIDNASIFQDDLDIACRSKQTATKFCEALGIMPKHQNFIQYRWNPNDAGSYYHMVKSIIRTFLLLLRKKSVDVLVTSESKNVWHKYGTRDAKILGQTAKLWDPWFQMGDLLLVLERLEGSRTNGTAKLTPWPIARLDTFSPKASIPGIAPEFIFKDWNIFWTMVERRVMPDEDAYSKIEIPTATEPDNAGLQTISEAKDSIVSYAIKSGYIENRGQALGALRLLGEKYNLDPNNALAQYWEWLEAIEKEATDGE